MAGVTGFCGGDGDTDVTGGIVALGTAVGVGSGESDTCGGGTNCGVSTADGEPALPPQPARQIARTDRPERTRSERTEPS